MKAAFKNALSHLSPRQKQVVGLVLVVLVLGVLVMVVSQSMEKSKKAGGSGKSRSMKMSLMSDKVEKDMWVAAEGQNIKALEKSDEEMRSQMEKLKKELEDVKEQAKDQKKSSLRLSSPSTSVPPPPGSKKAGDPGAAVCNGASCSAPNVGPAPFPALQEIQSSSASSHVSPSTGQPPKPGTLPATGGPPRPGTAKAGAGSAAGPAAGGTIRMFKGDEKRTDTKAKDKKGDPTTYLPAGSFMKAVLLSGIDAPTSGGKTTAEPYPVLMGVTDLSVLPNRYRMNLKECFIIGAGYGNISDERAYIRTETLSCIRTDSKVIEISMKGHVMGEDGKLGLRGRLVSKQGQQIAMAIFAGTLGGLSTAITPQQQPQLNLFSNPTQSTNLTYARPGIGDVGQAAALGGAGNALNMIAQYYMRMAERLFPIIEIDAGRTVEVVVLKGQELKVAGGSRTKKVSSASKK
ncbi:MAG: TraB/VirB10 family protein [Syntrophus sp. (in: bacteria)]